MDQITAILNLFKKWVTVVIYYVSIKRINIHYHIRLYELSLERIDI